MISYRTSNPDPSPLNQGLNPGQISLQPFNHLPDELLLSIFRCIYPTKRCLLLSICRKWNDTLLKNHSLWDFLVLDDHFSFQETLSILRLFNSRSGYRLKHVLLGKDLTQFQDLIEIIEELRKSAASLRTLGLVERHELSRETRRLARSSFPKLHTLNLVGLERISWLEFFKMSELKEELGINNLDEEMRYLCCGDFLDSDEEETKWLSGLKYFESNGKCFPKNLRTILNANKSSLKHLDVSMMTLMLPSDSETSNFGAEMIDMEELETLCIPWDENEALALSQMLGTRKWIKARAAKVNCLQHFFGSEVELDLYDEDDEDEQTLLNSPTILVDHENLLRKCKFVNQLGFSILLSDQTEAKLQLDVLFKLLIIPSKPNTTFSESILGAFNSHLEAERKELGIQGSDPAQEILLPDLVKLSITNPVQLDGKLLHQLVQSRKSFKTEFGIELLDDEWNEIVEAEWEARGWMV